MGEALTVLVASDFHYAGPTERRRRGYESRGLRPWWMRWYVRAYYRWVWMADLTAHYVQLRQFLHLAPPADWLIVNGDYSCDSAFLGVMEEGAFESASQCLAQLRQHAGERFAATIGDHELGKRRLGGDLGGLRAESFRRAVEGLGLKPFWELRLGRYVLMGVTSTLLALPVYGREGLAEELPQWQAWRAEHLEAIRAAFRGLRAGERVLLFCHDPTALPFLLEEQAVAARLNQVEHTIIGHLHTPVVFRASGWLAGMPEVRHLGNVPRRLSSALRRAQDWQPFNVVLCPSIAGTQLFKDGGFLTLQLHPGAEAPLRIQRHRLPWLTAQSAH
ncbi:metallophosphoesterase [Fontisphaera persica]|uniref:metallophosphoesterase n=1 Tax=Fontisphaera persica TaxID=2974023 RepID=UPI0024BF40A2|nr:metallophosphoesterase [Fontisphaera persica]WCJ58726.1 metallophosphoesterase [Fontisphaera persica]